MTFGGIDEDQYTGKLYEFPLVNNNYWGIQTTGLYYGGKNLKRYSGNVAPGVIDTGSASILIPKEQFDQILENINAQVDSSTQFDCLVETEGHCVYGARKPCSNFYHLDELAFEFAKTKFKISP